MPLSTVTEYQRIIAENLRKVYPCTPVEVEWKTAFGNGMYSPRLDVAVGPFAVEQGFSCIAEYDMLMAATRGFLDCLVDHYIRNLRVTAHQAPSAARVYDQLTDSNQNARCFLAIEIENAVSRKHLMGGAINAAALGRIGIVVAWTDEKLTAFVKLKEYLDYLAGVKHHIIDTSNLIILSKTQFQQALES